MQATNDTVVADNYMTGATNACWDHWEAPIGVHVRNNDCTTVLYGTLVTGTNTAHALAGQAQGGDIHGNIYHLTGGTNEAGVWLNGLGPSGSGASNIVITDNTIIGDGTTNFVCEKVTGASADNIFGHNTCKNSGTNSQGMVDGGTDSGGTPTNTKVDGNTFDGIQVQSGNIAVISLFGTNSQARGNRIIGGSYPSAYWLGGTNDRVNGGLSDAGTGATCNLTNGTNPVCGVDIPAQTVAAGASTPLQWHGLGGFNKVHISCGNLQVATNNAVIYLRVGESSTFETSSYSWGSSYILVQTSPAAPAVAANTSDSGVALTFDNNGVGSTSTYSAGIEADIPLNGSRAIFSRIAYSSVFVDGTGKFAVSSGGGDYYGDSNPITDIEIFPSSGNWAGSGECQMRVTS